MSYGTPTPPDPAAAPWLAVPPDKAPLPAQSALLGTLNLLRETYEARGFIADLIATAVQQAEDLAQPDGDLGAWREEAERLLEDIENGENILTALRQHLAAMPAPPDASRQQAFYVVFDGPPDHESGRFVEVETADGEGLSPEQTGAGWDEHPTARKTTEDAPRYWRLGPCYPKAMPAQPDVNEGLLTALEALSAICTPNPEAMKLNHPAITKATMERTIPYPVAIAAQEAVTQVRAAIAAAEQGAAK